MGTLRQFVAALLARPPQLLPCCQSPLPQTACRRHLPQTSHAQHSRPSGPVAPTSKWTQYGSLHL